mgnify:FL=1
MKQRHTNLQTRSHDGDSVTRIADATINEILKNGVLGLRLASVARQAKVSTPLIYKYFGNREGLIAEVLGARIERDYLDDIQQIAALLPTVSEDTNVDDVYALLPKPEDPWRYERRWLRLEAKAASRRIPALHARLQHAMQTIEIANTKIIDEARRHSGNKSTVPSRTLTWMFIAFADGFTNRDLIPSWVSDQDYHSLLVGILKEHVF